MQIAKRTTNSEATFYFILEAHLKHPFNLKYYGYAFQRRCDRPFGSLKRIRMERNEKTIETCSQNTNDIQAHKIITLNAPMEK